MEDYLRAIHALEAAEGRALTSRLATEMGVAQASVTNMVKRLAKAGLVQHQAYKGVRLTPAGSRVAIEIIRHHRLLELYLSQALGVPWDRVHEEADRLEHHISEELEAAIAQRLGHPTMDPHGDPIPTAELEWPHDDSIALTDLAAGQPGHVQRVTDQAPETLRALAAAGLVPGASVELVSHSAAVGVVHLRVEGRDVHIAASIAATIRIARAESFSKQRTSVQGGGTSNA